MSGVVGSGSDKALQMCLLGVSSASVLLEEGGNRRKQSTPDQMLLISWTGLQHLKPPALAARCCLVASGRGRQGCCFPSWAAGQATH